MEYCCVMLAGGGFLSQEGQRDDCRRQPASLGGALRSAQRRRAVTGRPAVRVLRRGRADDIYPERAGVTVAAQRVVCGLGPRGEGRAGRARGPAPRRRDGAAKLLANELLVPTQHWRNHENMRYRHIRPGVSLGAVRWGPGTCPAARIRWHWIVWPPEWQ